MELLVEGPADVPVAKAVKPAEPPAEKKLAEKPVAPKVVSDDASGGAVAESVKPAEPVEAAIQPAGERVKQMLKARKAEKPISFPGVDQVLSKKMFTLLMIMMCPRRALRSLTSNPERC